MENFDEIFTEDLKPIPKSNHNSMKDTNSSRHKIFGINSILETTDDISNLMSTSMNFDSILKSSLDDINIDQNYMTISSSGECINNSSGHISFSPSSSSGSSSINNTRSNSLLVMVPTTTSISPLNSNNSDKDNHSHINLAVTIDNLEVNLYALQQFSQAERDVSITDLL